MGSLGSQIGHFGGPKSDQGCPTTDLQKWGPFGGPKWGPKWPKSGVPCFGDLFSLFGSRGNKPSMYDPHYGPDLGHPWNICIRLDGDLGSGRVWAIVPKWYHFWSFWSPSGVPVLGAFWGPLLDQSPSVKS